LFIVVLSNLAGWYLCWSHNPWVAGLAPDCFTVIQSLMWASYSAYPAVS